MLIDGVLLDRVMCMTFTNTASLFLNTRIGRATGQFTDCDKKPPRVGWWDIMKQIE